MCVGHSQYESACRSVSLAVGISQFGISKCMCIADAHHRARRIESRNVQQQCACLFAAQHMRASVSVAVSQCCSVVPEEMPHEKPVLTPATCWPSRPHKSNTMVPPPLGKCSHSWITWQETMPCMSQSGGLRPRAGLRVRRCDMPVVRG